MATWCVSWIPRGASWLAVSAKVTTIWSWIGCCPPDQIEQVLGYGLRAVAIHRDMVLLGTGGTA